jgi:hypothetical protein
LAVVLLGLGCSDGKTPKLLPVKGKVTIDGAALTRGSVSFRLQEASAGSWEPAGTIDADGTYTLYTNQKPGAPAGKYYVLVTASEPIDPSKPSDAPKSLVHPKYADATQKLLVVEVSENAAPTAYDLKLSK